MCTRKQIFLSFSFSLPPSMLHNNNADSLYEAFLGEPKVRSVQRFTGRPVWTDSKGKGSCKGNNLHFFPMSVFHVGILLLYLHLLFFLLSSGFSNCGRSSNTNSRNDSSNRTEETVLYTVMSSCMTLINHWPVDFTFLQNKKQSCLVAWMTCKCFYVWLLRHVILGNVCEDSQSLRSQWSQIRFQKALWNGGRSKVT